LEFVPIKLGIEVTSFCKLSAGLETVVLKIGCDSVSLDGEFNTLAAAFDIPGDLDRKTESCSCKFEELAACVLEI